jgi:outer membrane protein assembly factor BamB
MKKLIIKILAITAYCIVLTACAGFFDKDNTPTPTPLTPITADIKTKLIWRSGVNFGIGSDYLKMLPAVGEQGVFTASREGVVTASAKNTGRTLWHQSINAALTAGVTADSDKIFLCSRDGKIFALSQTDGKLLWQTNVPSEVLAPPAAADNIILVKTIDGQLTALSETDGRVLWHFQQTEPTLILRGGSAPKVSQNDVVVGFANGNLAKLTLHDGSLLWQQTIAIPQGSFAIERMVDIDADPVIFNNRVYVATYQGKIVALELRSGKTIWSHDISSYTGLTVDKQRVYVSDATSQLWAFDADTGTVDWRQTQLTARNITGPAALGNYIVVADEEGYLHWINKQDGHFAARDRVPGFGVLAAPVVSDNVVYVLTKDGRLAAYTFG